MVARFCAMHEKKLLGVTDKAMRMLKAYAWPGNIRELENIIERGVILTPQYDWIQAEHLFVGTSIESTPDSISDAGTLESGAPAAPDARTQCKSILETAGSLDEVERMLLQYAVEQSAGNLSVQPDCSASPVPALLPAQEELSRPAWQAAFNRESARRSRGPLRSPPRLILVRRMAAVGELAQLHIGRPWAMRSICAIVAYSSSSPWIASTGQRIVGKAFSMFQSRNSGLSQMSVHALKTASGLAMVATELVHHVAALVQGQRIPHARHRHLLDQHVRRHRHHRNRIEITKAGTEQGDRTTVGVAEQDRRPHLEHLQQRRQLTQGLEMQVVRLADLAERPAPAIADAGVDQRWAAGSVGHSLRKVPPHRHAAKALVQKDHRQGRRPAVRRNQAHILNLDAIDANVLHPRVPFPASFVTDRHSITGCGCYRLCSTSCSRAWRSRKRQHETGATSNARLGATKV